MAHYSCIGWVQVGGAWALCVLHFHVCPWLICYSCVCHNLGGLFGICCTFCYSFLTSCGMDESLGLHSLYLASSLGWVLLGHKPFLLQSNPCPLCGSDDTSAISPHCFCHVIIWLVLTWPLLGLLYTFLVLNSRRPVLPLGLFSCCSSFLGPFYSFGHPQPILILHSHGFLLSLLGFPSPNYHILFFWDLLAFPPTPFTSSFLRAPSTHFCLLSIPHNAHGFTTSFFGLP